MNEAATRAHRRHGAPVLATEGRPPAWRAFLALFALCVMAVVMLTPSAAWAQEENDREFRPPQGAPFFLLTDTSYASSEEARVRMEVRREDLWSVTEADGAEIALYRVDRPLDFLRQQRDLHRIDVKAAARPEGLANTLSYLWDRWWLNARMIWQNIFDGALRRSVTKVSPQLKTSPQIQSPTTYVYAGAYKALPGLTEVSRMRYPVEAAKPIAPPKDLKLDGSSSNFTPLRRGNIYIPLGRQKPGLYVVEAAVGRHRAVTLLFVTDTLAVTKTAQNQFLLWAARRDGGTPVPDAKVIWSDLNGVLASGGTDGHGVFTAQHSVPETSYAFGQDHEGGVFITENYYYDSEIYNAKLYAYTDRPLYRPGDEVNIRLYGREFQSATRSTMLPAGPVGLTVMDATGTPVHQSTVDYRSDTGGHAVFKLPENAPVGGYDILLKRGDDEYTAAFRVAPYVKPHFEMHIEPGKSSFKTGEELKGRIRLRYPDGSPVRNAEISLSARAQVLTMVDGDLAYGGLFPVQIDNNQTLSTDSDGEATFKLPPVKDPSKVILTALATDGAAQRVRSTKDLLVERAASAWRLQADRQFASPNEAAVWNFTPLDTASAPAQRPARWIAIHQESQTRTQGDVGATAGTMKLALARSGSYTIELRDADDRLLGAAPFWVSGSEIKPPQGAIEIVLDKPQYKAGDTARALITFPVPVKDALLTLERDQVDAYGRLTDGHGVASLKRLNERQWEARIDVRADHAPNITFSVAYVQGNEFGFQNAGIVVEQPTLQVTLKTDRMNYLPGDTVTVDIDTRNPSGQGVAAVLSLAAVDDMVYALQPELAPTVQGFFYHLRRNNVRTHSSLSFISFDEAVDPRRAEAVSRGQQERGIKVLERPRRDERDTVYFHPAIRTDAQGHARVSFTVPDALTRWRLTAKAYGQGDADGLVGEKRAYVQSDKPFFARWTSSTWLREGDEAAATITLFNQTAQDVNVDLRFTAGGQSIATRSIKARSGANVVSVNLPRAERSQDVTVSVMQGGRVVDQLAVAVKVEQVAWLSERQMSVPLAVGATTTAWRLPPDARDVRMRLVGDGASAWSQVADGLIDYPYGCVEQTASRLIPLAYALQALPGADTNQSPLRQRLYNARLRLASMAGPDAVFGWWGRGTEDNAFLSAYAYHADHLATQTLGMVLPPEHWERLLDIYSKASDRDTLAQRAWTLWMMQDMGLPTGTMTEGLLADLTPGKVTTPPADTSADSNSGKEGRAASPRPPASPPTLGMPGSPAGFGPLSSGPGQHAVAMIVARELARKEGKVWPDALNAPLEAAYARLEASQALLPQAVLAWSGRRPVQGEALLKALQTAAETEPTVDRALALSLLGRSMGPRPSGSVSSLAIRNGWQKAVTASGQAEWRGPATMPPGDMLVEWDGAVPATAAATQLAVRYRSSQGSQSRLPVTIVRRLYLLQPDGKVFKPKPVQPGEGLRTDALYLDEVSVQSTQPQRHALLELALPPGAMLETGTWGVDLPDGDNKPAPLERAIGEATSQGYVVPLDELKAKDTQVVRHLVRFGQKGRFRLPAARLWRMYQPEAQAVEQGAAVQSWLLP